ncbi:uncharacterized protein PV06_08048 [Exophiala oligosperma]|uniref:Uncharacterized protein n=2 Tax=Chaetothyriales TaxID=34395 RepID=A0A0D2D8J2_9EURO|nr:uncharacterized protein PV06_08048 [Exophiala oligosperma]KAJ9617665.1 hypothetical protein H2204_013540 [Knufia peltigerae]KIW39433.1 hypothetical protein PV06_08048 [Exophiala oligosperma]
MSFTANSKAPRIHPDQAPQEPTGQVAADSLAAESLSRRGEFSKNVHAEASSVSGSSSTLNNTDTSAAKVLRPAPDSAARGDDDEQTSPGGEAAAPAGASDFGASTTLQGSKTGPDPNIKSSGTNTGSSTGTSTGVRPHVDVAPGYTASVTGTAAPKGTYQPKGDNLEDADETETMPKGPKTFVGDVGGQDDPGRSAEQKFVARNTGGVEPNTSSGDPGGRAQRRAADSTASGGAVVGEQGGSFGALSGSERA